MAENKCLFLFGLLLILISSSESNTNFDVYQMVFQWNPATCSNRSLTQKCSTIPSNKFTISGLWPTRSSPYQVIERCRGSDLNRGNIESLVTRLERAWPNVITGRGEMQVWREEWEKHGTCSEKYLNQFHYFTFALNSFAAHDMLKILGNIKPIEVTIGTYTRNQLERSIRRVTGVTPALRCNRFRLTQSQQLHEISLCYSKDDESLQDCPSDSRLNTCPDNFNWFPYMKTFHSYFQIVFQWEPATCRNTGQTQACSTSPRNRFSIQGVWPIDLANRVVENCYGSPFDAREQSIIEPQLRNVWPDLIRGRQEALWRSEWTKRGTCSEEQLRQLQYFNVGVSAYNSHDILEILRRNGTRPNHSGRMYENRAVRDAIRRATGKMPILHCNKRMEGKHVRTQLSAVVLCYDVYGRQLERCYENTVPDTTCPTRFYWYPL